MAWLICGTIPDASLPVRWQTLTCDLAAGVLRTDVCPASAGYLLQRGTPTLYAACTLASAVQGCEQPAALLAGDIGDGVGSAKLYRELAACLTAGERQFSGITFHYLFPDLDGHNRVLAALQSLPEEKRPLLVADAGYMYAAKMSGYAREYDLFTPDVGELSFLADERAPHPLYTRGFLLNSARDVPGLVQRAWQGSNTAKNLLVKAATDTIVIEGEIRATVSEPDVPVLEAIGGTGDIVAGLVTAMLHAGMDMERSCLAACRAARLAGQLASPTPATRVREILACLEEAVTRTLAAMS